MGEAMGYSFACTTPVLADLLTRCCWSLLPEHSVRISFASVSVFSPEGRQQQIMHDEEDTSVRVSSANGRKPGRQSTSPRGTRHFTACLTALRGDTYDE